MRAGAGNPGFGRASSAASAEPPLPSAGGPGSESWRATAGSTEWCTLRVASVAGVRHRLAGRASDDSFAWAHRGDRIAVAVADGLGSLPGSGEVARRAGEAAVSAAIDAVGSDPAAAALEAVAAANRASGGAGATTLVVAVVERSGEGALARVGDSTAFAVKPGGDWSELFQAPDPDLAGSATAALPADDPPVETVATGLWDATVLVLATDGVADPWRDGPTTVAPSLVEVTTSQPSALALLAAVDFSRQGCHDDRTLVCLWARPSGPDTGDADAGASGTGSGG